VAGKIKPGVSGNCLFFMRIPRMVVLCDDDFPNGMPPEQSEQSQPSAMDQISRMRQNFTN
jgi:hypothetical protein